MAQAAASMRPCPLTIRPERLLTVMAFRQPVARMIPPRRSIWSVPWWFGLPGFGRNCDRGTMAS